MSDEPPAGRPSGDRLVVRWWHVLPLLGLVVAAGAFVAWQLLERRDAPAGPRTPLAPVADEAPAKPAPSVAIPTRAVVVYRPGEDGRELVPVDAEIFDTASANDRLKQVVGLVLGRRASQPGGAGEAGEQDGSSGPDAPKGAVPDATGGPGDAAGTGARGEEPEAGSDDPAAAEISESVLPEGTELRAAFVDRDGTAFISFSAELLEGASGGSRWEQLAVYSIVNSVVRSLPEVERVQVLVDGAELETLAGHVDLRYPLAFDGGVVALEPTR